MNDPTTIAKLVDEVTTAACEAVRTAVGAVQTAERHGLVDPGRLAAEVDAVTAACDSIITTVERS